MATPRATVMHAARHARPLAVLTGLVIGLMLAVLPVYGLWRAIAAEGANGNYMLIIGGCLAGLVAAGTAAVLIARRGHEPVPGPVELERRPDRIVLSLPPHQESDARLVGATWRLEVPAGGLLELDAQARPHGIYPVRRHAWHCEGRTLEFSMPLDSRTLSIEPLVEACRALDVRLTIAGDWLDCIDAPSSAIADEDADAR